MPHPSSRTAELPTWLVVVASVAIAGHLLAVLILVLAAPSGPWFVPMYGPSMAFPPQFAQSLSNRSTNNYLQHLKLTHNYHFVTNRVGNPGVYFEVRLKAEDGEHVATLRFPDPNANPWVRHRYNLLAEGLGNDQPIMPPQGEAIAAPGQEVRKVQIWDMGGDRIARLTEIPEHTLADRRGPTMSPSPWALLLSKSYARYLCRKYGAAKAEVVRVHQDSIPPMVLVQPDPPAGAFEPMQHTFGDLSR